MGFHNGHAGSICEGGSALYSSCEGSSQVGVAHETSMSMTYLSRLERQAHLTRPCSLSYLMMLEESKENDDRNWNS